jgi:hypothetical protein
VSIGEGLQVDLEWSGYILHGSIVAKGPGRDNLRRPHGGGPGFYVTG